jgi:CspA family cold shock protein
MTAELLRGTVTWYNPRRAFGFIRIADGHELFVHRSAIAGERRWLIVGQKVCLTVVPGRNGPEAAQVVVTEDMPIPERECRAYRAEARRHDYACRIGQDPRHAAPPRRSALRASTERSVRPTGNGTDKTGNTGRGGAHGEV